jgi:hypothetical protein
MLLLLRSGAKEPAQVVTQLDSLEACPLITLGGHDTEICRQPGSLALRSLAAYPKNTRRNAIGNSYNTAPLSFNPMSHVGTNAQQSSLYGSILS